jgi:hypothetical protein
MGARDRLLREPPAEFQELNMLMHQDLIYEITRERPIEMYLAENVRPKDRVAVLSYLDALLARHDIDSSKLKGLLKKTIGYPAQAKQARGFLEAFRDNLRTKTEKNV